MSSNDTTARFKADITDFKKSMQEAARYVRLANSEFKEATAGMSNWASSTDGLTAKCKQLTNVLEAQKRQLATLQAEYDRVAESEGEDSRGAQELAIRLNNQQAAIKKTEASLSDYATELDQAGGDVEEFADYVQDANEQAEMSSEGFTVMKGALANLVADGIRLAIDALKDLAAQTFEVGSQFEADMSKVAAVSGANAEEVEQLKEKALEMGESTVFSASQSAEAFNYMAMAGWSTQDMLEGIEGIMNLAAASGEDLATTSDIVTDALTAMGYAAGDSGHFADVLAAAASSANTNVGMMGETFKYAAPIAGALGFNIEDTATAIGLMANAGIKGSQAGTALRSMLSRLSAPPTECAAAMDELGISLTDSEGNMKSLDQVMKDLRSAFSGLSETEQTAYAKSIAGQEAMSGLLAIVNTGESDFENLSAAIYGSAGAAEDMADTMTDNVNGQLTLLQSNIEGKMIRVFEEAAPAIKEAIKMISEALDGLDWDAIADGVGELATKFAQFVTFCLQNGTAIKNTLVAIGTAMATIFVVTKIGAFVTAMSSVVSVVKSAGAAFTALKASEGVMTALSGGAKVLSTELVAGGGALSNFTAGVQFLLNPMTLLAAGVAAVGVGMADMYSDMQRAAEEEYGLSEASEDLIDKIHEAATAQEAMNEVREESVAEAAGEAEYLRDLKEEYNSYIDANGQVKSGCEERANFILNELASAMGMELSEIQSLIDANGQLSDSIDQIIEKKQMEAVLSAYEADYGEAVKNNQTYLNNVVEAQNAYSTACATTADLQSQLNDAVARYQAADYNSAEANSYANEVSRLTLAVEEATETETAHKAALDEANTTYQNNQQIIDRYEGLKAASISGNEEEIRHQLDLSTGKIIEYTGTHQEQLQQQYNDAVTEFENIKSAYFAGNENITTDMVNEARDRVVKTKSELEQLEPAASEAGQAAGQGFANGISSKDTDATNAASAIANDAANGMDADTYSSGRNFTQGFINGISAADLAASVQAKAAAIAASALSALKITQKEGSPSKLTYQSGVYFSQGYINGIASMQKGLVSTVKSLTSTAVKTLAKASFYDFAEVGAKVGEQFGSAMSAKMDFMLKKMQYDNEQKIADFDKTISSLESQRDSRISALEADRDRRVNQLQAQKDNLSSSDEDKARKKQLENQIKQIKDSTTRQTTAIKNQYQALIDTQKDYKKAYQTASSEMISEYQKAINSYSQAAQELIDDTINGITTKYSDLYNTLLSKQDNLIAKLKSAGDLFTISGAGVMTVNDIAEQTRQIREYTQKLQEIKKKVSSELFDEITNFDMKEGSAYIDRLLALTDEELELYNDAYTDKLEAASKAGNEIYKTDFEELANDYQTNLNKAFAGIPKQLEDLGTQAMKGFVNGLTQNTSYMDSQVRTFVNGMVDQFKRLLKIQSPSKVMAQIGEYTGEGFVEGLSSMLGEVKGVVEEMTTAVKVDMPELSGVRASVGAYGMTEAQNSYNTVTNNYNLVQNNNSPKSLSALETYQARRQQIALIKAFA